MPKSHHATVTILFQEKVFGTSTYGVEGSVVQERCNNNSFISELFRKGELHETIKDLKFCAFTLGSFKL